MKEITINHVVVFFFPRPMLNNVLKKFGLDLHLPCHASLDHKAPAFNERPECMEILSSVP